MITKKNVTVSNYTEKRYQHAKIIRNIYELLCEGYISQNRHNDICKCGKQLYFLADMEMKKLKLHTGNFCKFNLCPMCSWRRSRKDAYKIAILMQYIYQKYEKEFIFLTLTAPNVSSESLKQEITNYNKAFNRLLKRKDVMPIVKGYVRKLEITYNQKLNSYHPHFHVLIAINKSYFNSRDYITQSIWLDLWRSVMHNESIVGVDVRKVKISGIPSEISKEAYKIAGYQSKEYKSEISSYDSKVFNTLFAALKNRQVITYNDLFNEAHNLFKAGELNYLKEQDLTEYAYMVLYKWGYGDYIEAERRELTEKERQKFNTMLINEVDESEV